MTLGWGTIKEVTPSGKTIKGVDPINGNWTRVIIANDTTISVEYQSGELIGSVWPDPMLRIVLITEISFIDDGQNKSQASFIKFSVHITGDWGFAQPDNDLHVDFSVEAPVRTRSKCDTDEHWTVSSDTATSKTYRVFLANDTATSLSFLKHCIINNGTEQSVKKISDPVLHSGNTGWTTTVVFPSFTSSLFYDPSFALLLGYSNEYCDPLLAWILPVSFIAGAAALIVLLVALMFFPPTAKLFMGSRSYQIQQVRAEIKFDVKAESKMAASADLHNPDDLHRGVTELQIITNEDQIPD